MSMRNHNYTGGNPANAPPPTREFKAVEKTILMSLSGNSTDIRYPIGTAIVFDPDYSWSVALRYCSFYQSIFNIQTGVNDLFVYSPDLGVTVKTIVFDAGVWGLDTINTEIQARLRANGDNPVSGSYVTLGANYSTLKTTITISNANYIIYFNVNQTFRALLGFSSVAVGYNAGIANNSAALANITNSIEVLLINTDIITGSYTANSTSSSAISSITQDTTLYSFSPDVYPGTLQIVDVLSPVFLPLSKSTISSVRVWVLDNQGRPVYLAQNASTESFNVSLVFKGTLMRM